MLALILALFTATPYVLVDGHSATSEQAQLAERVTYDRHAAARMRELR
jgi:hypothetical protein